MRDVKEKIDKLCLYGVSKWAIERLVQIEKELSRMEITADYRIILPDYDMEIKMEPLVKAVFLLFLRYEDGIRFKDLPDYKTELYDIYIRVRAAQPISTWPNEENVKQSIENVTNPLKNSINEKCARIREAFVSQFSDDLAKSYYVTGQRGEPKHITMPRELLKINCK